MTPKHKKADVFLCNWVISLHRIMCNGSVESSHQGLHFFLLHLRLLSNLWGHYDPQTKKKDVLPCNGVISSGRIMYKAFIGSSHQGLHFFWYTDELWAMYEDVMTKKAITWLNCALGSLSTFSILSYLSLKPQTDQSTCMLTLKVIQGRWRSNRNLSTVACNCSLQVIIKLHLYLYYLLGKESYVFNRVGLYVCLCVCMFVSKHYYSNNYEQIAMKFYWGAQGGNREKWERERERERERENNKLLFSASVPQCWSTQSKCTKRMYTYRFEFQQCRPSWWVDIEFVLFSKWCKISEYFKTMLFSYQCTVFQF